MPTYIRQESLFDLQTLYDLEPTHRFEEVFSSLSIAPLLDIVGKKKMVGPPLQLNYPAMIYSLLARYMDRIPTIKDLVRRLHADLGFKRDCGFLLSDAVPSESAYSRLIQRISQSKALERINQAVLTAAMEEGALAGHHIAIDATHVEARDQAPARQTKKPDRQPQKRGRKPKAERAAWLETKQAEEDARPLYEKKVTSQLPADYEELVKEMPQAPQWGIKKNSDGRNVFWFGFKVHLAVDTTSQFILHALLSSGNLNDGKAAIPLLKGIQSLTPAYHMVYALMDAGYDLPAIYTYIHQQKAYALIAYNKRRASPPLGVDADFAPTCVRDHAYRYDSFDAAHQTLKYTAPKECRHCPLASDSLCQKVFKIKRTNNLRHYTAPARGTKAWERLYAERSAVERVNGYLKEFFQLNNIRHKGAPKAEMHMQLAVLVYNGMKLASFRYQTRKTAA